MAKECKVPVYVKGEATHHASVDQEDLNKVSEVKWLLDSKQGAAYYDTHKGKKLTRIYMHRLVMGCKTDDGKIVLVKDGNKLNCRRSNNLSFSEVRRTQKFSPGAFFPRKVTNFSNYVEKNHPKTPIANFLSVAQIDAYSTKEVVFSVEESDAGGLKMQDQLQTFFESEFGYKGRISVVRRVPVEEAMPIVSKPTPVPAALQAVPTPAPLPSVEVSPDAIGLMTKIGQVFGIGVTKDTAFEFVNFGVRRGDEVHTFRYEKTRVAKLPESHVP